MNKIVTGESIFKTNIRAAKWVKRISKWYWPTMVLNSLFSNLSPFVNIYMSAQIINEIAGKKSVDTLIHIVLATLCINLGIGAVSILLTRITKFTQQQIDFGEHKAFLNKVLDSDFCDLENGTIQEQRWNVYQYSQVNGFGLQAMLNSSRMLTDNIINIILSLTGMASLIFLLLNNTGNVKCLFFVVVIFILIVAFFILSFRNSKTLARLGEQISADRTKYNSTNESFGDPRQQGKEYRIYNMKHIVDEFKQAKLEILKKNNKIYFTGRRNTQIPEVLLSNALNFVIYAFVCINALTGLFVIGNVILYVGYIQRFVSAVKDMAANLAMFRMNHYFLNYYLNYVQVIKTEHNGKLTVDNRGNSKFEVEFRNVSFKYPGQESYALKNLSLKLNIGQRLAVVGMNGSGKTTMIKLLCRLYDPTDGEILLNGIDIRNYDYDTYNKLFSVVFQDFSLFAFTLGQNIAASSEVDDERAKQCLIMAGLGDRFETMPKGLKTPLYKGFDEDGVEISGGEAQKVALARALYKDAPFIVLDEPTAALDPIAEFEIYSRFNKIINNKTAIYISHRLSSCRFCNDIAVFHEGELVQYGSHNTLIADESGKYYELWNAQAQYYVEN